MLTLHPFLLTVKLLLLIGLPLNAQWFGLFSFQLQRLTLASNACALLSQGFILHTLLLGLSLPFKFLLLASGHFLPLPSNIAFHTPLLGLPLPFKFLLLAAGHFFLPPPNIEFHTPLLGLPLPFKFLLLAAGHFFLWSCLNLTLSVLSTLPDNRRYPLWPQWIKSCFGMSQHRLRKLSV
ncbi:MAG: hypothetical protein ACU841_10625 [Gammaproteobacteria bacterium]